MDNINNGARFVRADLHIHSYGADDGSFDVKDKRMIPENIVDTAINSNLSIISITDHNEIGNSKKALDYSNDKDILVIPGIEVSTTQGHLLVYFEKYQDLRNFHGKLTISEDKERCSQGIVECLNLAKQYNGFGILAHIDLESGFEKVIGRFSAVIEDVFSHDNLLALEISKKDSFTHFTDEDSSADRKNLVASRRKLLNQYESIILPKVMSSDSHGLDKLGRNAEGENKLTRVKVDELSFDALRIALLSYESRVRIEDLIPEKLPHFVGISLKGGLLDGQKVKFSRNLTCIIGGRGTGKSTLLESLRESSGNNSSAKVVDSDVWPDEISLVFEDETGSQTLFSRSKNNSTINITDPVKGIASVTIESYGQGETAETIQHSDEDPQSLLNFLDSFIDVEPLSREDDEVCDILLNNQSELGKLRIEITNIPETKRQIISLKGKKGRLEKDKVGELVTYQTSLIRERTIREELISDLKELVKSYKEVLSGKEIFEHFSEMSDDEIIVGKKEFAEVKRMVDEFSLVVDSKSEELDNALQDKIVAINDQLKSWKGREREIQVKIDNKKEELERQGIPFDIGKINQIAKDLDYYEKRLRKLNESSKTLKRLENERKDLINRRKKIKLEIYKERYLFCKSINENLKNSVDGLHVSAKFEQGCYSPQFERNLKQLMDWRKSPVKRSELIASTISPLEFSEKVKSKNLSILQTILDQEGVRIFSDRDISDVLEKIITNKVYEDFETLKFEDRPKLQVTKVVQKDGKTETLTRSIAQLSLGQQQSILLAILIQSKSNAPLLIDQPEDNLDSEFIYKTIVHNLKRIKETRQVIIVTHNANIAVLGDAELVIPLKSTSIRSSILNRGSIDRSSIREDCCAILEGGNRAFLNRQKIYNISS